MILSTVRAICDTRDLRHVKYTNVSTYHSLASILLYSKLRCMSETQTRYMRDEKVHIYTERTIFSEAAEILIRR